MSEASNNINEDVTKMDLLCRNLQSTERLVRQKALKDLFKMASAELELSHTKELFDLTYLHIIKCYADKFETSRSLAASIFSEFIKKLPPNNDYYLGYLVPVLKRRLGMKEIIEDSEEMRLQLIEQLHLIVSTFKYRKEGEDHLLSSYNDIMDILLKTLSDPYSAVQRQACEVIKIMPKATPFQGEKIPPLAVPLINLLKHRQSPVRALAIETLGLVGLHVTGEGETITKIISAVNLLILDLVPKVRLACGRVGCMWMMKMIDRYSYYGHILPMVLLCLIDENDEVREEISERFIDCGQQYYNENESNLNKIALVDHPVPNYDLIKRTRPSLGCRALVQRRFQQIPVVVREMQDWKEEVRLHSLKLLHLIVFYSESHFSRYFDEVYPALAKCCQDTDLKVVAEARRIAILLGVFIKFDFWFKRKLEGMKDMKVSSSVGVLRCFGSLLSGVELMTKINEVEKISCLLSYWEVMHNLDSKFQKALLDITEQLVELYFHKIAIGMPVADEYDETLNGKNKLSEKAAFIRKIESSREESSASAEDNQVEAGKLELEKKATFNKRLEERFLLQILVKILAFAQGNEDTNLYDKAMEILNKLAGTPEYLPALYESHLGDLIDLIQDLELEHSERSDRIILLSGCLTLCGFRRTYFSELKNALKTVLENSDTNARIKILSSISIAMLIWSETMNNCGISERLELLRSFAKDVIEPYLIWKAGRSAESIRTMATQALCSMAQGAAEECKTILPLLAVTLNELIDDNNAITRTYALRTLMKSGSFNTDEYTKLAMSVIARLDDPCADVRLLGTECISLLDFHGETEDKPQAVIRHIISTLILHLDDPELNLQPILIESISRFSAKHRTISLDVINSLSQSQSERDEIIDIKNKIINMKISK